MNPKPSATEKTLPHKKTSQADYDYPGDKTSKTLRILELYDEFTKGHPVNKAALARKYHVDERSIQRDIDEIRIFLSEVLADGKEDECKILYSKAEKCFRMEKNKSSKMSNSQILAVSKIILESRAFPVEEVNEILQKMVDSCVPAESMKLVQELIGNERFHYVGIQKESLQDKLWEIGLAIHEKNLLSIDYCKGSGKRDKIKRVVAPVSILFSEYYFYLNAFIMEKNEEGRYQRKYDFPAIFRLDRIENYKKRKESFVERGSERFEEGEFRKRVQFMYGGDLQRVLIKFYGENPEPITDRLPTATIVEKGADYFIIKAEVYGKGILMWLLSQGKKVELLSPESLRLEMKESIEEMLRLYQE